MILNSSGDKNPDLNLVESLDSNEQQMCWDLKIYQSSVIYCR
jgi:hypothetical protein